MRSPKRRDMVARAFKRDGARNPAREPPLMVVTALRLQEWPMLPSRKNLNPADAAIEIALLVTLFTVAAISALSAAL